MARFDEFAGGARAQAVAETSVRGIVRSDPARLARTVETEIIPRLMLLHRPDDSCGSDIPLTAAEVTHFTSIVLTREPAAAELYVATLQARGASLETIFLKLFAPTARLLGDLWREDVYSFAEVTIGLSRLQRLLRTFADAFEGLDDAVPNGRNALIAATPGEQHSFGLSMVETFMRRSGWEVEVAWGASEATLGALVRAESFDLVGLSLSGDALLDRLASTIQTIKRASRNRMVQVIVGGRYFIANPDMVSRVGADAGSIDARDATAQSDRLMAARLVPVPR